MKAFVERDEIEGNGRLSEVLTSSPSEKHGWRVLGGMMGPVQ